MEVIAAVAKPPTFLSHDRAQGVTQYNNGRQQSARKRARLAVFAVGFLRGSTANFWRKRVERDPENSYINCLCVKPSSTSGTTCTLIFQ